jgi:hypothetical protein
VIDDPRFAGKFGSSSSGGRGGGGFGGDRGGDRGFGGDRGGDRSYGGRGGDRGDRGDRRGGYGRDNYSSSGGYSADMPLPTAPRSAMEEPKMPSAPAAAGPTPAQLKAQVEADQKAAKAAKRAEKEQAEKRARETKEAAAAAAAEALEKEKTAQGIALAAATDALASGLKGPALLSHINGLPVKPTAATLLRALLAQQEDVLASKWWTADQYGAALSALLKDNMKEQVSALYEVQAYCHAKKFPKVEVKGKPTKLIEVLLAVMLNSNIVDAEGLLNWADDENPAEVPGRLDAIVQTSTFVAAIREAAAAQEGDEEDDDEIDAPREFVR